MSQVQHELQYLMDRCDLSDSEKLQRYGHLFQRLELVHHKSLDETAPPTLKDLKTLVKRLSTVVKADAPKSILEHVLAQWQRKKRQLAFIMILVILQATAVYRNRIVQPKVASNVCGYLTFNAGQKCKLLTPYTNPLDENFPEDGLEWKVSINKGKPIQPMSLPTIVATDICFALWMFLLSVLGSYLCHPNQARSQ